MKNQTYGSQLHFQNYFKEQCYSKLGCHGLNDKQILIAYEFPRKFYGLENQ